MSLNHVDGTQLVKDAMEKEQTDQGSCSDQEARCDAGRNDDGLKESRRTAHTPGPWAVALHAILGANGEPIVGAWIEQAGKCRSIACVITHDGFGANARLMAAAPDYWEAVEQLTTDASELEGDDAGYVAITKDAYDALLQAHAKARGDQ